MVTVAQAETAAAAVNIRGLTVRAFTVPTETPEADGTLDWSETVLVLAEVRGGDESGLGYTYGDAAAARFIVEHLAGVVRGRDAVSIPEIWSAMQRQVRNAGRPGVGAMAISAVDNALWDLKARLLRVPLSNLLGRARDAVPVYGSGGFTNFPVSKLSDHMASLLANGVRAAKMKVGRDPARDRDRVRAVRDAVGPGIELMVDANGAYDRKQALEAAEAFRALGVRWLEEPVSSDDLDGLRFLRDRGPAGLDIAAGEYGYDASYFRRMLEAGAVDVLQVDVTRCGGITGFLQAAHLAYAFGVPLSCHTAPSLHRDVALAVPHTKHVEYFFDHARIERLLFEGAAEVRNGALHTDLSRPGNGLELRSREADSYRTFGEEQ